MSALSAEDVCCGAAKAEFIKLYTAHITRPGSKELLDWLVGSDFFTAPASTRYHGAHPGGLVEHSINVFHCLRDLLVSNGGIMNYDMETIAIVSLLHDICKVNFYTTDFRNVKENGVWVQKEFYKIDDRFPVGHSEKSVIILQQFMQLSSDEVMAIRAHMGGFDVSAKGGHVISEIFEKSTLAVLTHLADTMATYLYDDGYGFSIGDKKEDGIG